MLKYVVVSVCAVALSGCAGTMGYVFDPAISSDKLDEVGEDNKLKSMKGDRRLIRTHRVSTREVPTATYEVCAETHADAIGARSGSTKLSIVDRGSLDDALAEVLTKTVERSVVSDTVRQLHWHTCNAKLNRWLTRTEYRSEVQKIREGALLALMPAPPKEAAKPAADGATTTPKGSEVSTSTTTTTTTKAK